jgi:uncharacterized protein
MLIGHIGSGKPVSDTMIKRSFFFVPSDMNRYHKKYLYDLDRVLERLFIMLDQREAAETDFQRDDTLRAAATHLTDRTVFFAKRMWERWQVAVPYLLPLLVEDRIRQDDYRTEVSWPFIQDVLCPLHHEVKRLLAAPTDPHPAPRLRHTLRPLIQRNLAQIRQLAASHGLEKLWLFGSVLRDDFRPDSDIDFLFRWTEAQRPDDPFGVRSDLSLALGELLGHRVDLIDRDTLRNPYFLAELDETKQLIYDRKREQIPA